MKLFRLKRIGEREKEREKKEKKRERKREREREREREENFVVEEKIEKSAAKHILKQWNLGWLVGWYFSRLCYSGKTVMCLQGLNQTRFQSLPRCNNIFKRYYTFTYETSACCSFIFGTKGTII